ncbi:MAG: hypothetical protein P1V97_03815, partial [Planctomycetota bacterium]|nr:hypothetical protein [Planctomycetota bacterium]
MTKKQGFWGMALLLILVSGSALFGHSNHEDSVVREHLGEGQRLAEAICLKSLQDGSFPVYGSSLEDALGDQKANFDSEVISAWRWIDNGLYSKCLFYSSRRGSDLFLFIKDQGQG